MSNKKIIKEIIDLLDASTRNISLDDYISLLEELSCEIDWLPLHRKMKLDAGKIKT